jgi:NTP pyrophosphatase (non-canonical NTP hydrolase)
MIYPGKYPDELQCDERKRLAKERLMNTQQEKGEPVKSEAELGPLTFDHMREKNVTRCTRDFEHDLGSWSAMEWAAAAAGELGELCNALKKQRRRADKIKRIGANKPIPTKRDVADEIADTVLYLDLLAAREGVDLGEAIRRKFNEKSDETGSKIRL